MSSPMHYQGQADSEPAELPPHDIKAERALLGSMLLAGEYTDFQRDLIRSVSSGDFFQPDHAIVHRALLAMVEAETPIDAVTLRAFLKGRGEFQAVGGDGLLGDLLQSVPSYANGGHYAGIVRELSRQRQALAVADALSRIIREATTPELAADAIRRASERLDEIGSGERADTKGLTSEVDWVDAPSPEAPLLVDGMLRTGEVMVLAAPTKSRKSQLAIQLGLAVATGRPFLDAFSIVTPGAVLYLNYELAPASFENRASGVCRAMGITSADMKGRWHTWHMRENPIDAMTAADAIERLKIEGLGLVIVDPLRNAYPAMIGGESFSENSNAHMAAMVRRLMRMATKTGASVLVIHHTTKGAMAGKSLTDQGAGAGSLAGGVDAHYSMTPHEQDNCHVLDGVNRSIPPFVPVVIEATWPTHRVRPELDATAIQKPGRRKADHQAADEMKAAIEAKAEKPWTVQRFITEVVGKETVTQDQAVEQGVVQGCKRHIAKSLFKAARDGGKLEALLKVKNSPQRFKVSK